MSLTASLHMVCLLTLLRLCPAPLAELHLAEGEASLSFVRASYSIETSDAERIGVDQVAKILPGGKASGSEQREWPLSSAGCCCC